VRSRTARAAALPAEPPWALGFAGLDVSAEPFTTSAQLPAALRKLIVERNTNASSLSGRQRREARAALADVLAAVVQRDADAAAAKKAKTTNSTTTKTTSTRKRTKLVDPAQTS
jgi:hypothetical protein